MNAPTLYWMAKYKMAWLIINLKAKLSLNIYKFKHWFFSWNVDDEGDITFSIAKVIHLTKYKEHTIIRYGKLNYQPAAKYVNARES